MLQECRSVMLFKRHKKISEGSYGIVYRGEELSTGHVVALKKVRRLQIGSEAMASAERAAAL